ncbi:MAG: DNA-binding protein [Cyclobacteriaceae bacterium]|nr:DNA-binding protein [Cyclobacteriaceae bacterium]MBX2963718.1 DNA-binding protein [Cyclobacteriaceae bacterium]
MDKSKKQPGRKRNGKQVSFDFKLYLINKINNGRISVNYAAKKHNVSRSTIQYWMKKLSNYEAKVNHVNKDQEIKKLKDRIEALEFIKDFQQDIIIEFENVTGQELSKKYLPEHIANEIQRKKKKLTK